LLSAFLALLIAACGQTPSGQEGDFAVLARSGEGYEQASPETPLVFPRDHGMHPGFRIEWWYLTANLEDAEGRHYGVQWTLFRTASRPPGEPKTENPWQDPQVFMAHFAVTTPEDHVAFQRYARGGEHGGLAQAGAQAEPFMAWLDDWSLQSAGPGWLPLELRAQQENYAVTLHMEADRPLVLQGAQGFSQKHPDGGGSHYYSQPFLSAQGRMVIDGVEIPVAGDAWLDREWSSQFLQPDQAGWDWFALHLDSGEKLMMFRLRTTDPAAGKDYLHAVLIDVDASRRLLDVTAIDLVVRETANVGGRELPMRWTVSLPEIGRQLEISALHPDQWLDVDFPYWEGVVLVTGDGPGSRGRGYLEMTGYPAGR
jgi:predicted secreted hydrolase